MRVSVVVWAAWTCVVVWAAWTCGVVSGTRELVKTLPQADQRLRLLQAKLSQLSGRPETRIRESPPDQHLSQMWSPWQTGSGASTKRLLELRSPGDKLGAIRHNLLQRVMEEARQLTFSNQSIMSIGFLAFGVIVLDVLGDAIYGGNSNIVTTLGEGGAAQARVALLPGLGIFGDNFNNLAEIVLNMITIYLYRDESPDCGERLLCESNQQAVSRGILNSLVTYISGFAVSFLLHEAPLSRNLEAMRAGRKGHNCLDIYPSCSITL